jgi:hypothetical protein
MKNIETYNGGVYSSLAEVDRLISRFKHCTLPRPEWSHEAHLTVAAWHLMRYAEAEALDLVRTRIKRYNASCGIVDSETTGYHETITVTWIKLTHRLLCHTARWDTTELDLYNLVIATLGDKTLPLKYYSRERLMSVEARRRWIEPDLDELN